MTTDQASRIADYAFVDFGCSSGGSMEFGSRFFGGRGIGIDIDPRKVEKAKAAGHDAIAMDASGLDPASTGRVRFAIMSHFIEHLPTIDLARRCIESACRVTTEFVLIQQPYFDADGWLFEQGLKLYWSDWHGHTLHMSSLQLQKILERLRQGGVIKRYLIGFRFPFESSAAPEVHSLASPRNQVNWISEQHPPKPLVDFPRPVFRETCAIAMHTPTVPHPQVQRYINRLKVAFDSAQAVDAGTLPAT